VLTSLRFFDREECRALESQVTSLGELLGFSVKKNGEYPSWKPVRENQLLDQMSSIYERMHGKKPRVTAIHAGLECGILRDKIGPIDAVSFGPTIMGAHSPQERVEISTVTEFWKLLTAVLAEI
jgi:dipeptidase D